jgi:outer membrane protein OmpA-like peptidoglycan-associated protein
MVIFSGCKTIPQPVPEETLPAGEGGDTAYYRFRPAADSYAQKDLLGQVFFHFDQSNVLPNDRKVLQALALELRAHPNRTLRLIGYCDWYGKEGYNLELGKRRASAVAKVLGENGIDETRIQCESRGSKDSPPGLSKGDAQGDRRVDILCVR